MARAMILVAVLALLAAMPFGCRKPSASAAATQPYVANSATSVYHVRTCGHAARIAAARLVQFQTTQAAADSGYRPCEFCGHGRGQP